MMHYIYNKKNRLFFASSRAAALLFFCIVPDWLKGCRNCMFFHLTVADNCVAV